MLVAKGDGGYRFCTDFRNVKLVTKADSYPIPWVEDCIDKVGSSQFVSKFDLLKGYWQVPLTPQAKRDISICHTSRFLSIQSNAFRHKKCPRYLSADDKQSY